ncbi:hypothetical protein KUCAC02_023466 [Chaenocephalus aceratus]|uniref:Uncharacterized protein n=1 Tax=Chaenocephalus aceratus TaxID=36190 RepID=A0ACB9XQ61_CHAAC|nr:hypothetical protein KUCAC02_023466 [Chaenocephalus aceratus]
MCDFSSLGLADWLVKQCKQMGINNPLRYRNTACRRYWTVGTVWAVLRLEVGRQQLCASSCAETVRGSIWHLLLGAHSYQGAGLSDRRAVSSLWEAAGLKDCIVVGGMDMVSQALELSKHHMWS